MENENSNEQLKIDGLTIEHILPQKENAIIWKQALGEDYEKTYSTYLHTLGNLTITGYNSELGAKSFSDKKKIIMQFSKAKILNEAVLSAKVWNESAILNRAKALAGKTMEIFNIEKGELVEKAAISTAAQVFTFEDQDAVAGTEPKSFTFYGENISVKSYAKMLDSMIALLYDLDSTIMENLAKNKYKATSGDRVYVTTDKKDLKRMGEIDNAGIFYEKNLSAKDILKFIKALIEQYEMDTEEFEFICI